MPKNFEERMEEVRAELASAEPIQDEGSTSPSWVEDMFKNGWPNCWGDFNNVMR
jgi:hypothetical protein